MRVRGIVAVLVVAAVVGGGGVGGSVAQTGEASLHISGTGPFEQTVGVGESQTFKTVLNDVDSVGSFEYEFAVENRSALRIVDVQPGPGVSAFNATIGPENATVTLEGKGANVESSGYVDRHVRLTVRGIASGETELVPSAVTLTAANGSELDVDTTGQPITVTDRPIADVEMRPGVDVSGSSDIAVEGEGDAIVAAEHADRGVGGFAVNLTTYYADGRAVRFVDVTVQGDPEEQSIRYGPNGTYVEVSASGLDGEATGDVHLLNVTLRGVERDTVLLEPDVERLQTADGARYEVDTVLLATANVAAVSEQGPPTFTEAAGSGGAAEGTAGGPNTTDGGNGTTPTSGSGPGFTAAAALAAVALAVAGRRYRAGE